MLCVLTLPILFELRFQLINLVYVPFFELQIVILHELTSNFEPFWLMSTLGVRKFLVFLLYFGFCLLFYFFKLIYDLLALIWWIFSQNLHYVFWIGLLSFNKTNLAHIYKQIFSKFVFTEHKNPSLQLHVMKFFNKMIDFVG